METRETREPVDVKTLTKRAISIYLKQAAGEEVAPAEIARLRDDAHAFPDEKEFKDFRVAVGTTALQGRFQFGGKDAGSEIMRILFGEKDALLYDSVVTLSRALDMTPRDYSITSMLNIYDELTKRLRTGEAETLQKRLEVHGYKSEDLKRARFALERFLTERAGASIREQMLLRHEVARATPFMETEETAFMRPRTEEEIKLELQAEQERMEAFWIRLKEGSFEQAPLTVQRLLNSRAIIEELKWELERKPKMEHGKNSKVESTRELLPEEEVACRWVFALKRLAHQLRLDAEDEDLSPEDVARLQKRAAAYEAKAEEIFRGLGSHATEMVQ